METSVTLYYVLHRCMFYVSLLHPPSSHPPLLPSKSQHSWLVQASAANSAEKHYSHHIGLVPSISDLY
jgi:hypothetical protein